MRLRNFMFFLMIFPLISSSQILWDNFEDTRVGYYEFVHGGMTDRLENPMPSSSVNSSELCAQYVRNPGETYDVIVIVANGLFLDLTDYLDGTKKMSVDVFSPAPGIPLQITLEDSAMAGATNYPDGRHSIYTATTTVTNEWETIEFEFAERPDNTVPDGNVTSLILLFDIGNNTNDTYYFDNLYGPEFDNQCDDQAEESNIELADWDCHWNLSLCPSNTPCDSYDYISGWLNQSYNPDPTTINTSKYSGEYTRNPDANGEDVFIAYFSDGPLDLSEKKFLNFQLYGPPRPFYMSFQDDASNDITAFGSAIAANNQWQQFTVDLTDVSAESIARFVLLFDQGVVNWDMYYIDNMHLSATPLSLDETAFGASLSIFPQPANDVLYIDFETHSELQVSLYDLQGKKLLSKNFLQNPNNFTLDIADIESGFYVIKLQSDSEIITQKIHIIR